MFVYICCVTFLHYFFLLVNSTNVRHELLSVFVPPVALQQRAGRSAPGEPAAVQ